VTDPSRGGARAPDGFLAPPPHHRKKSGIVAAFTQTHVMNRLKMLVIAAAALLARACIRGIATTGYACTSWY